MTKTAVASGPSTTYSYLQVAHGDGSGFEAPGFDASGWQTGAGAFGSTDGVCPFNNTDSVKTSWAPNTDMLLRTSFTLPSTATNLNVQGTVDNDATVYINGTSIGTAFSGNCHTSDSGDYNLTSPDALLSRNNVIAIRGSDYGVATYLDQSVTYQVPVYSSCLLYDAAKSAKSGSTIPVKFQICDPNGNNLSSADIRVSEAGLTKVDNTASSAVADSGNSNPDSNFRYDAALGGYIFNLSTKGLSTGTYALAFTVGGDSEPGYTLRFDIK